MCIHNGEALAGAVAGGIEAGDRLVIPTDDLLVLVTTRPQTVTIRKPTAAEGVEGPFFNGMELPGILGKSPSQPLGQLVMPERR